MKFRIEVSDRAQADIKEILRWLEKRSIQGADRWHGVVHEVIDRLSTDALLYAVDPRSRRLGSDIRTCPFSTPAGRIYQIVYVVEDRISTVHVLRVRGPGERPLRRRDLN